MADMQVGVRSGPTIAAKRQPRAQRSTWSDQSEEPADAEEEEDEEEGSDSDAINVLSDSVPYAQLHFPLNDNDWLDPDSNHFLINMPLCELMKISRVKTEHGR
eukprot:14942274-Heterocapsa_arctica.AAC.1